MVDFLCPDEMYIDDDRVATCWDGVNIDSGGHLLRFRRLMAVNGGPTWTQSHYSVFCFIANPLKSVNSPMVYKEELFFLI